VPEPEKARPALFAVLRSSVGSPPQIHKEMSCISCHFLGTDITSTTSVELALHTTRQTTLLTLQLRLRL